MFAHYLTGVFVAILTFGISGPAGAYKEEVRPNLVFLEDGENTFSDDQKTSIERTTKEVMEKTRTLLPDLMHTIQFTINTTGRDLSAVRGVTGRADRVDEIEITISTSYPGGIDGAVIDGLRATLFHELHHTVRGWTIHGNKFGYGIDIAAINEGLADVFAEIQTGHNHNSYSDDTDFHAWAQEILALPKTANYGEWMFQHPDGREAIGYRTGTWLVKRALRNSDHDILSLSQQSVGEIYQLAGYEWLVKD
jgi:uncharacterized protein YjaZ